jgi:hypothetical protein
MQECLKHGQPTAHPVRFPFLPQLWPKGQQVNHYAFVVVPSVQVPMGHKPEGHTPWGVFQYKHSWSVNPSSSGVYEFRTHTKSRKPSGKSSAASGDAPRTRKALPYGATRREV